MNATDNKPLSEQRVKERKEITLWDLLENPKPSQAHTAGLIEWSMNYDLKTGTPYLLFLDLIGYSQENYGQPMFNLANIQKVMGFMELDYLGDALKEYAENPQAVLDFIEAIDNTERGE
jgi:hypothetical protein